MSNANVIFTLDGIDVTIQCSQEEKMKDICQRYTNKINSNINSLSFLYGGNKLNLELKFKDQINSIDNNEMKILVYKYENNEISEIIDNIIISNNKIKETINGIKFQLENIINIKNISINDINIQLKNINIVLNSIHEDIKINNEKLKNILNDYNINEQFKTLNINKNIQIKTYDNGRYEGQLINGKKEGKGIFYYNSGSRYEGDWKND